MNKQECIEWAVDKINDVIDWWDNRSAVADIPGVEWPTELDTNFDGHIEEHILEGERYRNKLRNDFVKDAMVLHGIWTQPALKQPTYISTYNERIHYWKTPEEMQTFLNKKEGKMGIENYEMSVKKWDRVNKAIDELSHAVMSDCGHCAEVKRRLGLDRGENFCYDSRCPLWNEFCANNYTGGLLGKIASLKSEIRENAQAMLKKIKETKSWFEKPERTYKCGDRFINPYNDEEYMLAHCGNNEVALVSLRDGLRRKGSVRAVVREITKADLGKMEAADFILKEKETK